MNVISLVGHGRYSIRLFPTLINLKMNNINFKTIDLFKTQHGWFATFTDDLHRDYPDIPRTYKTAFTRHARGCDVEKAIASSNPGYMIFVIGG